MANGREVVSHSAVEKPTLNHGHGLMAEPKGVEVESLMISFSETREWMRTCLVTAYRNIAFVLVFQDLQGQTQSRLVQP